MIRFLENEAGEKMPFKMGFACLLGFEKELGRSFFDLGESLTMEEIAALFWHAHLNGCNAGKSEGWSLKIEKEDVITLLDSMFIDFCNLIPELVNDYMAANDKSKKKSTVKGQPKKKAEK